MAALSPAVATRIFGCTGELTLKKQSDDNRRTQLIRLIHVARRELRMEDDDYRAMLRGMTALGGKTSSADLGIKGLELVLEALKRKGFKIRAKGPTKTAKAPAKPTRALANDEQSKLIRHLWLEMHSQGIVRDPSEASLAAYVCRIAKIEALQWLNGDQARNVIETLKKWQKRAIKSANGMGS